MTIKLFDIFNYNYKLYCYYFLILIFISVYNYKRKEYICIDSKIWEGFTKKI